MSKTAFLISGILLFSAGTVVAATLSVTCPKVIALKGDKTYAQATGKYVCFSTFANAKKAGYRDERTKGKWYPVTQLSGSVGQITDSFRTTGSKWRMNWSHPGDDHFSIVVYDAVANQYEKLMVNTIGATVATSNYYGAGRWYLDVSSDSTWGVTIEEYR